MGDLSQHVKWLDVGGIRTRYLDLGSGEPIVFLHGGHPGDTSGAESAEVWDLNLPQLSERYRCIAIDRLGQGYTDNPKQDSDYTMRGSVGHVVAFLETLGLATCDIVGHSRGGYVAAQVALQRPDLIRACVLVSSNSAAPGPGRNEIVFASNPHPPLTRERARYAYEGYSYSSDHIKPEWLDQKVEMLTSDKHRAAAKKMFEDGLYESTFQPTLTTDREAMFARLENEAFGRPVMLFWGFNDPTAPIAQGYELYRLIAKHERHCRMHVVNRAGHYSYREAPQAFNRTLLDFLEDVRHGN